MKMEKETRSSSILLNMVKARLIVFSIIGVLLMMGFEVEAQRSDNNVTAMYLLGDSSVDCGLNTLFYNLLHRNSSLLPCQPNHSHTTLLIPHLLADKIGIPHSQPMYAQNGSIESILNGLSFGSPQATIMSSSQSYQSLNQQLRQVLDTIQVLRLRLGQLTARHFIQSSLFYLSFGEVDFINLYLVNSTTTKGGEEFARLLVSTMSIAIRNLKETGARKIVFMGIPPLGCTPRALSQWRARDFPASVYDENGCVKEVNELVVRYNELMGKQIVKLNAQFGDAEMVFCDAYKGMMEIIGNPKKYGFKESKSACCGVGRYNANIAGCVAMEIACSHVERYVWWDLFNPTAAVNSLLADSAWRDQPFSNFCHPSTIQHLTTIAT